MGRIAEALKRAEEERRQAIAASAADARQEIIADSGGSIATIECPAPSGSASSVEAEQADSSAERVSLVEGLSENLIPFFERSSLVTEQYRSLRTRLLSQNPQYEHRVLAITSAVPKEGKSVTTLNLGATLAEIRHLRVLMVDGDFRRSSLAKMLNQRQGPGLAEVISGEATYEEALQPTPIPNLMFMPAGSTGSRYAAELLTASPTQAIFKRMENDFHYTLVDTPPATTVTDVGIIGQMCTGVIMIIRLHRTEERAAKRAVRLLQVNSVPIIGCLLIGREAKLGRYGYGYGYGYNYYRYYDYYKKENTDD